MKERTIDITSLVSQTGIILVSTISMYQNKLDVTLTVGLSILFFFVAFLYNIIFYAAQKDKNYTIVEDIFYPFISMGTVYVLMSIMLYDIQKMLFPALGLIITFMVAAYLILKHINSANFKVVEQQIKMYNGIKTAYGNVAKNELRQHAELMYGSYLTKNKTFCTVVRVGFLSIAIITGILFNLFSSLAYSCLSYELSVIDNLVNTQDYYVPSGDVCIIDWISVERIVIKELKSFTSNEGKEVCPASEAGLSVGDAIIKIDNQEVWHDSVWDVINKGEPVKFTVMRGENVIEVIVTPQMDKAESRYRVGIEDYEENFNLASTTQAIAFYNPLTNAFITTGHISSADNGKLTRGYMSKAKVEDITNKMIIAKYDSKIVGYIKQNTEYGSVGVYKKGCMPDKNNLKMKIAKFREIEIGEAEILLNISDNNENIRSYKVEITEIKKHEDGKVYLEFKILDEELGRIGLAQGMSGAPIIQKNKIIGAVALMENSGIKGSATPAIYMLYTLNNSY